MPDISKCENETCTLKDTCYRYLCEPDEYRQTYGEFKQDESGNCDYYWPTHNLHYLTNKKNQQNANI